MFFAGFVAVLAAAGMAAITLLEIDIPTPKRYGQNHFQKMKDAEHDMAANLGLDLRTWVTIRGASAVAGFLIGLLFGVPLLMVGGIGVGWFACGFVAKGVADSRRVVKERALEQLFADIADLIEQSNLTLDQALREVGENPPPELEEMLAPLRNNEPVAETLIHIAEQLRSPLAARAINILLMCRIINPKAFIEISREVMIPIMRALTEIQEQIQEAEAYPRGAAVMMGMLLSLVIFVLLRIDSFRAFYVTGAGQAVLLFVGVTYGFLVWLAGKLIQVPKWQDWDLEAMRKTMEELVAG